MSELKAVPLKDLVAQINIAKHIVVLQADNPDGDSLGSALALEEIIGDLDKKVSLYCGIDLPSYLHYFDGWDRVQKDLPSNFDLSIIVDASSQSLFETLPKSDHHTWLAKKPCLVIDHHQTSEGFWFEPIWYQKESVATAEVIYDIALEQKWTINTQAKEHIVAAIMSDSLGLTSEATSSHTVRVIADIVESGVSLSTLDNKRREYMKKSPELVAYKGRLLERIEYWADNRIATVTIPWEEIEEFSPHYNPPMLVMEDMRMTEHVAVVIAFKRYNTGKVTGKIRTNMGAGIAADLASAFGGGGHSYASGFKTDDNADFNSLKIDIINKATELLDVLEAKR